MPNLNNESFQIKFSTPLKGARILSHQPGGKGPSSKAPVARKPTLWREGFAASEKTFKEKFQCLEAALQSAVSEIGKSREEELKALEPQLVDLALAIAKSILQGEIDKSNYDIQAIVSKVLGSLRNVDGPVKIHLNPTDYATLSQAETPKGEGEVQFIQDPSIHRACCAVETPYGTMIRDVDSLIAEIRQNMNQSKGGGKV